MRLLFFLTAITVMALWYAWYIRPGNRTRSNQILMVSGIVAVLLALGFLRLL